QASANNNLDLWSDEAFELEWLERKVAFRRVAVANSPAAARHVLLDNHANYVKTRIARNLLEPGLGRGLLTTEGAEWKRQGRIMAPALSARNLDPLGPQIVEQINRAAGQWQPGSTIDLLSEMVRLTLSIISNAMFSLDSSEELTRISEDISRY